MIMQTIKLHNGVEMPMEGFGVFQVSDLNVCEQAVSDAIATGYRLIDTASSYKNETAVGAAIRKSGVSREDLFVTSKAFINEMGYEQTKAAFQRTLDNLGFDYLDLYLIHMPFGDYYGAWRAMEELYKEGRIRAIGVSNFQSDRIIDLYYTAEIKPMVNQLELHPFYQREEELAILREYGIVPQAWASSRSPSIAIEWKRISIFGTLSFPHRIWNKSHRSTLPVRRCSTHASRARCIGCSTI